MLEILKIKYYRIFLGEIMYVELVYNAIKRR